MINLTLDEDETQIVRGARALLAEVAPIERLRASSLDQPNGAALAHWGWFRLALPEADGGLGLGIVEEALLHLEAGRHLLSPATVATSLAASAATGDLREAMLDGSAHAGLAIANPEGDWLVFDRGGSPYVILFSVNGIRLFHLSANGCAAIEGFDETLETELCADGGQQVGSALSAQRGLVLILAILAGIARAAVDLAAAYAKVREQFGRPIGSYQAIKHMCAEMEVRAYAAEAQMKLVAVRTGHADGCPGWELAAAMLTGIDAARANAADAIQIHGGIGFTADCDAHALLKRAHVFTRIAGGPELWRERVLEMTVAE